PFVKAFDFRLPFVSSYDGNVVCCRHFPRYHTGEKSHRMCVEVKGRHIVFPMTSIKINKMNMWIFWSDFNKRAAIDIAMSKNKVHAIFNKLVNSPINLRPILNFLFYKQLHIVCIANGYKP